MNIVKYYKYIEYLIIIISVTITILTSMYKIKHPFWDKQPVMRDKTTKVGLISKNPKFNIKLKTNQKLHINNYSFNKIYSFLDKNFSNNYNINEIYFKYIFNKSNSYNITLTEDDNIIGFIHCDPIDIMYNNHKIKFNYVDYLCISPEHRKRYTATILIASIINMFSRDTAFMFKIDKYKLPFQHILKSFYYVKDLRALKPKLQTNVERITPFNFYKYYKYTNALLKRYKFRKHYTKKEFYEIFLKNKVLDMFIINTISGHKTIIIGKKNIYNNLSQIYNSFEIDLIIGEIRYTTDVYDILSKYLKNKGYSFISIASIGNNIQFIKNNNFVKSCPIYYYTYNYYIPYINANDCGFNIN